MGATSMEGFMMVNLTLGWGHDLLVPMPCCSLPPAHPL